MNEGKIAGISGIRNESDLKDPVRLVCELKRDADPDIVLNQLYQFSPLQDSFSLNFLALVDGKPRTLSFKELLQEFIRHRETVIRRRTQFLLVRARQRKHTVEGLLLAHANIDEVIRVIRSSSTQIEAKERLMQIQTPVGPVAAGTGRRRLRDLHRRTRSQRILHAHADPGRRDSAHDARAVGQPGAREAGRRVSHAARGNHRLPPHPFRSAEHSGHDPRGLPRVETQARRPAPHGNQRRGDGRDQHGRSHHRRDDGRLDQRQRLRQADARVGLSGAAPRRQGLDRGEIGRGRPDPASVRRQHARLPAVLHEQGEGLLAQGLRSAAIGPRLKGPRSGESAEPGRGRADHRLPGGARFRPARPLSW